MEVAVEAEFVEVVKDEAFCFVDRGVELLFWLLPPTIQITPRQRTPVIPINNPIRIQHRDYFKYKIIP